MHEGPRSRALATDALPPVNSLRIQADDRALDRVNGVIHYSKGAAFFAMLEGLWEHQLPGSFQVQRIQTLLLLTKHEIWCCWRPPSAFSTSWPGGHVISQGRDSLSTGCMLWQQSAGLHLLSELKLLCCLRALPAVSTALLGDHALTRFAATVCSRVARSTPGCCSTHWQSDRRDGPDAVHLTAADRRCSWAPDARPGLVLAWHCLVPRMAAVMHQNRRTTNTA